MIYFILFVLLVAFAVYAYIQNKKRPVENFPEAWKSILSEKVYYYQELSETEKDRFRKRMMVFLSEVYIDTVNTKLETLDKILIAASAVIPVFGFPEWHYNNLSGIILYPNDFNDDLEFDQSGDAKIISGLVGSGRFEKQMILSRKALYYGFENDTDKANTGVHEFVHLIDKMDGVTDGVPERLLQRQYIAPWLKLIHQEMEAINNNKSDIRKYGGTNQVEFLAVASEYFFERPDLFEKKHPDLYQMLSKCFQQNSVDSKTKNADV
ncbi:zinc-dependent peptidase [Aequorivita lipolytica]|jgi:Mlc titration factor MtfA (ptsG expression regulator)|uniref:Zinc-dependent peptidase n=1 Tax=Aequorivita lipolytica TaxID=153267 RepID=A0A5C6YTL4_9FLAO|nr:M90 family metallopeptidase [Aequorivita lipolytica]TXD70820.1 zinc-dependent peptidase [Aequorivita lipolytica]SRX49867.1 Protein MtfA [Aequorivita lipolytica]